MASHSASPESLKAQADALLKVVQRDTANRKLLVGVIERLPQLKKSINGENPRRQDESRDKIIRQAIANLLSREAAEAHEGNLAALHGEALHQAIWQELKRMDKERAEDKTGTGFIPSRLDEPRRKTGKQPRPPRPVPTNIT